VGSLAFSEKASDIFSGCDMLAHRLSVSSVCSLSD
jgi:hypothetical protein